MIVVRVELHSAIDGRVETLGTTIIDNVGGTKARGNYRTRAWPKGALDPRRLLTSRKPHREGAVNDHKRLAEPVWTLVRKSLEAMGY